MGSSPVYRLFGVSLALLGSHCSHDWDAFDPRLGEGGTGAASVTSTVTGSSGGGATSTGGGGAGAMGGAGAGGAEGGNGGAGPGDVEYTATIADCTNPADPDPDVCEANNGRGVGAMQVDGDPAMLDASHAYLRFETDTTLAGKTIDSVTLRLRVPVIVDSGANQTGDVWLVEPFVRADLFVAAPATIGASPIALDMGNADKGETVLFDLPTSIVSASSSVTLGILPNTTDGVDYFNLNGAVPPALLIEYH